MFVIYGRRGCPHTEASLAKAEKEGWQHVFIEVPKVPHDNMCKLFRMMAEEQGHHTVPCVFEITFVGGNSNFSQLQ